MTSPEPNVDFTIMRTFNAPRELVFATMVEKEHLQKWWGPQGSALDVLRHEGVPGGIFHYRMKFGPGVEMYGRFDFREISPPERIVFVNGFADAQGERIRYAMSPTWPIEVLNTVVLQELEGKTHMTLHSSPLNASEIERQTFKAGHLSMKEGFGLMYDAYDNYLAAL
jgi:uncharacterized protein YndB with AHSA1/START domain